MSLSKLIHTAKYYIQFIPFKINFYIYCVVLLISFQIIHIYKTDTSSFISLIILMAKIAFVFSLFIIFISFISTSFCAFYFYWQQRKKEHSMLEIQMDTNIQENNTLLVQTKIAKALKPILGFVFVKLYYDQQLSTDKFLLTKRIKKQFIPFKSGIEGSNILLLSHIKEYHFNLAIIYFEDMLQFFSFKMPTKVQQSISNNPKNILFNTNEHLPKKTEEEKIRIEQLRKVEGEYLNYKKFDDSDDVRRIVWKIFAKNKELVVRTPEIMDPFASHIYMYASYYNSFDFQLYENYTQLMLNHFKNCTWTIFDTLSKKEFEVKYISDQNVSNTNNQKNGVQNKITLSNWHQDETLIDYFKPKNASILCIHSCSKLMDIENILSNYETGTTIFFVQMSKIFKSHYVINWILRIFLKAPKDEFSQLKSRWALHPLKYKIIQNENKITELLKSNGINFEII